jgi:hypothetical protein
VLELLDVGTEGTRVVSLTRALNVDDSYLHIMFDYRFLTDGKLRLSLGATMLETIFAPADDPVLSDPGRDTYAIYDHLFNLTALGFAEGATPDLRIELSNAGDPGIRFDGLAIETTAVPEPATLSLLALGGLALLRKNRRAGQQPESRRGEHGADGLRGCPARRRGPRHRHRAGAPDPSGPGGTR